MAERSAIEWCDSTWNPWIGCTKVSRAATGGGGCDGCYAEVSTPARVLRAKGAETWGPGAPRVRTGAANWKLPERWNKTAFWQCTGCGWRGDDADIERAKTTCCGSPVLVPARRRVFCASLADVFDNEVDVAWRADLFDLVRQTPNLDWLLLTKRVGNVKKQVAECLSLAQSRASRMQDENGLITWLGNWVDGEPPANVWLGATIVNQEEADRDVPKLLATPARVRFLSMEPLLGPVSFEGLFASRNPADGTNAMEALNWVIVGGESGHGARPMHPDWARGLRDQCVAAGVPFLFKQWGEHAPTLRTMAEVAASPVKHVPVRFSEHQTYPVAVLDRVGKKAAGRLLDGVTHDAFPEVS